MPNFNLISDTAVVVKPYEYEGTDNPKPLKLDLDYVGSTTYGEVVYLGSTADATLDVGDIVVYLGNEGVATRMNEVDVRIIDLEDILYYLS